MTTVEYKSFKEFIDDIDNDNLNDEQVKTRMEVIKMSLLFEINERLKYLKANIK
ncbi:MAG: hypothetical protein GY849_23400 [Deltaproteobacteria bacterium]|nr:hypothetical protein [Deltaproteobacteria bacterium]